MPCLLAIVAFFFPRAVIILLVLFSDYIGDAFRGWLLPLAGFFLMPYTTLVYAWVINTNEAVEGWYLVALIAGVLLDLGVLGGGASADRSRRARHSA